MPTYIGTTGNDSVPASAGYDVLYGLSGDDSLVSYGAPGYWDGGQGNDTLAAAPNSGAYGAFYGGDGNDTIIISNGGPSTVYGGDGNDTIYFGGGANTGYTLSGYEDGGAGNDLIYGPSVNSVGVGIRYYPPSAFTIVGGTGTDTIYTGYQADTLVWAAEGENDQIFLAGMNDTVFAGGSQSSITQISGLENGNETVNGAYDQGILYVTVDYSYGTNVIVGDNYSNHINGSHVAGSLWVRGGAGQDEITGGDGHNYFIMTPGGDFLSSGGYGSVTSYLFNDFAGSDSHINNFKPTDIIGISTQNFTGLTSGETLTLGYNLINGTAPVANTATFLYDGSGLYFDADGTGPAANPVLLAGFANGPATLTPSNFFITGSAF